MAIDSILAQIDEEIAKLTQIRELLSSGFTTQKAGGLKVKKAQDTAKTKKRRTLSPEARKRIADAQRRRWAAQKAKTK